MAILDRPMFQRPLTREQLSRYGLPAFANGGVVVQKFADGKEVKIPPGYQYNQGPNQQTVGGSTLMERYQDPKSFSELQAYGEQKGLGDLERRIAELERIIANPDYYGEEQVAAAKAELPKLKAELTQKDKTISTEENSTPVPEDIKKAKTPQQLREALLNEESQLTDEKIKAKQEEMQDNLTLTEDKEQLTKLEKLVKERSALYKKMLGDPKEGLKYQGLLQLAQFGLNLASAKGGNFAEKIANSAKDPLQTFAALGQEAIKDERAIDMLAIKGAEEELGRTQKPGTFGQLVQDLINSKGLSPEKAAEEATRIYEQKSGKTIAEMKDERYSELLALYTQELGEVDKAVNAADAQIKKEFGTGMFLEQDSKETVETGGNIVEIDSDAEFESLAPGTQYRNKGETQVRVK